MKIKSFIKNKKKQFRKRFQKTAFARKIRAWFAPTANNLGTRGLITNPYLYLKNTTGLESLSLVKKEKILEGTGRHICSEHEDKNNCTLMAVYNVFSYYRKKDTNAEDLDAGNNKFDNINYSEKELYETIKQQAVKLGYSPDHGRGLSVLANGLFAGLCLSKGMGQNIFKAGMKVVLNKNAAIKEIDAGRPFVLSLANGRYYDHSITVYGYTTFQVRNSDKKYVFLVVADGWSKERRYLAWTGNKAHYLAMMTRIKL